MKRNKLMESIDYKQIFGVCPWEKHGAMTVQQFNVVIEFCDYVCVWVRVSCVSVAAFISFFFFFFHAFSPHLRLLFMHGTWTVATTFDQFSVNSTSVYCSWTHKFHFLSIFSLKMGPTALFTHLKIILLQ